MAKKESKNIIKKCVNYCNSVCRKASSCNNWFYFAFRLIVGLFFAYHGATKFELFGGGGIVGFAGAFNMPIWIAFIAAFIELVGGLFIALGLFTRISAFSSFIVMIVAYILAYIPKGLNPFTNGSELLFLYLATFLILIGQGSGRLSLERKIFKKEMF